MNTPRDSKGMVPSVFTRYRSVINQALKQILESESSDIYKLLRYSMGWEDVDGCLTDSSSEGKAIRPALCLMVSDGLSGTIDRALPAAVSIELIHNFSLIHDDIQDRDVTRRHRPTVWALWGIPKAIIAGNMMRSVSDFSLWSMIANGVACDVAVNVSSSLTDAYLEMINGQYLDIAYEGRLDVSIDEYLNMISKKTGALMSCSVGLGAMLGSPELDDRNSFIECGRALGMVFQIRDDMLGIWGDEGTTGKSVGMDIKRKKNTLPIVFSLSNSSVDDRDVLREIYSDTKCGDKEVSVVLEIMERAKAKEFTWDLANKYGSMAIDALNKVDVSQSVLDDVEEVVNFLLVREH